MKVLIRPLEPADELKWRELWHGYCIFYKMDLSELNIKYLWKRIQDTNNPVHGICALDENQNICGILHYVLHESTSQIRPICCIQDLYVEQTVRKNGYGSAMMKWILIEMKNSHWGRVYWHTKYNNYIARNLYNKLTSKNEFIRYVVDNPDQE